MKTKMVWVLFCVCAGALIFQISVFAQEEDLSANELVLIITSQLDVNPGQAAGGAGALLMMVRRTLPPEDYKKVADAIPDIETLIIYAPTFAPSDIPTDAQSMDVSPESISSGEINQQMVSVRAQFVELGMQERMISKFMPIIISYAEKQGGPSAGEILKMIWPAYSIDIDSYPAR